MAHKEQIEQAKSNLVAVVISHGVALQNNKGICPFHEENTPSFTVNPERNLYYCFGCGSGGSAIDFVMRLKGLDLNDAVQYINSVESPVLDVSKNVSDNTITLNDDLGSSCVVPHTAPPPPTEIFVKSGDTYGKVPYTMKWRYTNELDETIGYMCRVDTPDGKKHIRPFTYRNNKWCCKTFDVPRPLYRLYDLVSKPDATVILVEGEKTCDALRELLRDRDDYVVVTWPGGASATKYIDVSHLIDRQVLLIPDNDQVGFASMKRILYKLKGRSNRIIQPPDGVPSGWDFADKLPDGFDIDVFLADQKEKDVDHTSDDCPFVFLGVNGNHYYFIPKAIGQIIKRTVSELSINSLIELAPLSYWSRNFPHEKYDIDKVRAAEWIVHNSRAQGVFHTTKIRGRGAWKDQDQILYHHGDYISCQQHQYLPHNYRGKYIYDHREALPSIGNEALSVANGVRILDIAQKFRWSIPAHAALLCGWIALAPVCGALIWRPHIWITGGAGSGKSTILQQFVRGLLKGFVVGFQGNSTEAGIRQTLQSDALPCLMDECESNTVHDAKRMQSILGLIRQSSSESDFKSSKGSTLGQAMSYHVQSMFCLASINMAMHRQPDFERIALLSLRNPQRDNDAAHEWVKLNGELHDLFGNESISDQLVKRSIQLLPITLENIKLFTKAAAIKFGSQREGDQYGTLMAGSWSLASDDVVTLEEATDYIDQYDWSVYREHTEQTDADKAMASLMSAIINDDGASATVLELLKCANHQRTAAVNTTPQRARAVLERYGLILTKDNKLLVSNTNDNLRKIMRDTGYAVDLKASLLRYEGAEKSGPRLFNGLSSRGVSIPVAHILNGLADL